MPGSTARLIAILIAAITFAGCGDSDQPAGPKPGAGETPMASVRIVSLSPALTQMVADMGHLKAIVGVDDSHATVFENKITAPTVGVYSNVRAEAIIGLKPTHVITMAGEEGPPEALTKLAETANFKLVTFPYPKSVRDVRSILIGDVKLSEGGPPRLSGESSLAHLLGDEHAGFLVANEMAKQLGRISVLADEVAKPGAKPKVLVVFAVDPRIQASGPNTVFDDLLTQYAGGYNAAIPDIKPLSLAEIEKIKDPEQRRAAMLAATEDPAKKVGPAPTFDREKLLETRADVILLVLPGEPPLKSIEEDARLADLRGLDVPAVKNNRVVLISDKSAQIPATGLPKVAAEMAKAIHPALAPRIDAIFAAEQPQEATDPGKEPTDGKPSETPAKDAAAPAKTPPTEKPSEDSPATK